MTEPLIKGAMIRDFVCWYGERFGSAGVRDMGAAILEDLRHMVDVTDLGGTFLAASWYPTRIVHAMLDALVARHSKADVERMMKEAARHVVRTSTTGVYRLLLSNLMTPALYAAGVSRFWRQLHTTGARELRIVSANEAMSIVSGWPGHHPILCTITIAPSRCSARYDLAVAR